MPKIGYIIITMIVVLVIATAVAFVVLQPKPADNTYPQYSIGVKAGDTFTYHVKGMAEQYNGNATIPARFYDINKTDYIKVTINNVVGPNVTYNIITRYTNGTQYENSETLDVVGGNNNAIFWGIFASNLTQGDRLRALRSEGGTFNDTETRTYASGDRATNIQRLNGEYYNADDTTQQLYRNRYLYVDKATGMLVELKIIDAYTSPQIIETVQYTLVDSNVFQVSQQ